MKGSLCALRFLAYSQGKGVKAVDEYPIEIGCGGKIVHATVYRRAVNGRPYHCAGTILAVGGMSVRGNRDPRLVAICRAMARCGFLVIIPSFVDIERFMIKEETVRTIADAIGAIAGARDLCPTGRVSVFAPSFSAGMCLIAASLPEVAASVVSICAVGAFGNVDTVLRFILTEQSCDEYARMIILRNFIHHSIGRNPRIERALEAAYLDNGFHSEEPELPSCMERLGISERRLFQLLRNDPESRMKHWRRIVKRSSGVRRMLNGLSVVSSLYGIKARVVLVHGAEDRVIPPSESVLLHERLVILKKDARLLLTPLISHGDVRLSPAMLPDILRLLGAFAHFFRRAFDR